MTNVERCGEKWFVGIICQEELSGRTLQNLVCRSMWPPARHVELQLSCDITDSV
jgi:hypothetical protein